MNVAGPIIRKARKDKKLTQKELAVLSGMAQSDISRVESENGNPSVEILERIAKGMGMKLILDFIPLNEEKIFINVIRIVWIDLLLFHCTRQRKGRTAPLIHFGICSH